MSSTSNSICVSAIYIYPIKSCRGVAQSSALLTSSGLHLDRLFMVVREDSGKVVTARQIPKLALVCGCSISRMPASRSACLHVPCVLHRRQSGGTERHSATQGLVLGPCPMPCHAPMAMPHPCCRSCPRSQNRPPRLQR